jgi:hypothetical protein
MRDLAVRWNWRGESLSHTRTIVARLTTPAQDGLERALLMTFQRLRKSMAPILTASDVRPFSKPIAPIETQTERAISSIA